MPFSKYLKPDNKLLMRAIASGDGPARFEALTVYLKSQGPDHLELALPYQTQEGESYPFTSEMTFELFADAMGVGIRLTASFQSAFSPNLIRVKHNRDLQLIRRRSFRRRDATVGLGYTKGRGALRTFREQWEKNVRILTSGRPLNKVLDFPRSRVNLSAGGIRLSIKAPVEIADLCLLLIDLHDSKTPICALGEVVWLAGEGTDGRHQAGLQFINILEEDRKRIDSFVVSGAHEDFDADARQAVAPG